MEWRITIGCPDYEVSDRGNVRDKETSIELTPEYLGDGWYFTMKNFEGVARRRPARLLVRAAFPELNWEYPSTLSVEKNAA